MNDPYLIAYSVIGVLIVLVAFIVFSLFRDGVKAAHDAICEPEKKKKEEAKRKHAA